MLQDMQALQQYIQNGDGVVTMTDGYVDNAVCRYPFDLLTCEQNLAEKDYINQTSGYDALCQHLAICMICPHLPVS